MAGQSNDLSAQESRVVVRKRCVGLAEHLACSRGSVICSGGRVMRPHRQTTCLLRQVIWLRCMVMWPFRQMTWPSCLLTWLRETRRVDRPAW